MAELLSVQVHAPVTLTSVNVTSTSAAGHSPGPTGTSAVSVPVEMEHLKADCGGARRLKKVDNVTQDAGTTGPAVTGGSGTRFAYLPKRHAVNIEFYQLTYSVSEGRKKGARCD